jgi:hypothetical protein
MTRETGFYEAAASDNACLGINPRGARQFWGAASRHKQTCMRQGPFWILTMMQSCASAA